MNSAFGIDHGEISKSGLTAKGRAKQNRAAAANAQKAARRQAIRGTLAHVAGAPKRAAHAKVSVADVGSGMGRSLATVGELASKSPAITGTALLAGGGFAGYKLSHRKKPVAQ